MNSNSACVNLESKLPFPDLGPIQLVKTLAASTFQSCLDVDLGPLNPYKKLDLGPLQTYPELELSPVKTNPGDNKSGQSPNPLYQRKSSLCENMDTPPKSPGRGICVKKGGGWW